MKMKAIKEMTSEELVAKLAEKLGVNIVMTSSIPVEEASDTVKKYL